MMWAYRVKLKHLLTQQEDFDSVQEAMNGIADVLETEPCFRGFEHIPLLRRLPRNTEFFTTAECANKLLARMYDYADANGIWIE